MSNTTVSVVIVTHNRKGRLKRCIESVLQNSVAAEELVVVDDSDAGKDCQDLVVAFKKLYSETDFKYIYIRIFPKRGVSFSRNEGIRASSGDIVAFIDDDCDAGPDWIERIQISHKKHPSAVAITGLVTPHYPKNYWNRVLFTFHDDKENKTKSTDLLFGSNYSFKRAVFSKFQIYFNDEMPYCSEDRYIAFQLTKRGLLMLYDPSIKVRHDFRTDVYSVMKQWLRYGLSDFYFWKLTPDLHDLDADYFRGGNPVKKLIKAPYRTLKRVQSYSMHFGFDRHENSLMLGIACVFFFYYIGVYLALIKELFSSISKQSLYMFRRIT